MVIYERFQLKGFDWEKFGVLDRWLLTRGGRTWRFNCRILGLAPIGLLYISIKHVCLIMKKQVIHAVPRGFIKILTSHQMLQHLQLEARNLPLRMLTTLTHCWVPQKPAK